MKLSAGFILCRTDQVRLTSFLLLHAHRDINQLVEGLPAALSLA
jgi:hypothetical protein